jgi:hypothetical protein
MFEIKDGGHSMPYRSSINLAASPTFKCDTLDLQSNDGCDDHHSQGFKKTRPKPPFEISLPIMPPSDRDPVRASG